MTYKLIELEINVGGTLAKQPADARQVADIIPGSKKHFDFGKGEESMANNDFPTAIQRFERVVADQRATELMRQMALISIVRCNYYAGNVQGVIQSAQSLRNKKPDSFYVRESFELEVKAHLANRNQGAAQAAIAAFSNMGTQNGMQEWAKSAELMSAGLAELKGDARAALQTYKKFSRDHDVGEEATLGEMRCLTAVKDFPSLNSRADSIIKDSVGKKNFNPRLLIAAYNGKGDAEDNGGKFKEALLNYLQGAMVLSKGEQSQEHEAALARASIACAKLATAEKDKTKKDTYKGRAIEMFSELTRTYGANTKYKAEVDKAIKDVK
jgi:outer membrane protein assembly factor BamD (BamD/ComL family)